MNRKTMDSFNLHYPLFLEALDKGEFAVCRWNESGATVDSAVPELSELVNDKKEWRAVIVHTESEADMAGYSSNQKNPFDFLVNEKETGYLKETQVPLVRLTQILGGVPTPIKRFNEQILEEKIPPHVIYIPVDDEDENRTHELLTEKYRYDGRKPTEMVLIALRDKYESDESNNRFAWQNYIENSSSEFWKRNLYPSPCRFLFFETTNQGSIERSAEMFRFWTSVLIITLNDIDSDFLQAYRLYKLSTVIDTGILHDSVQQTVNRLAGARATLSETIRIETQRRLNETSKLPDYTVDIPVTFDFSDKQVKRTKAKRFGLAAKNINAELLRWEEQRAASENEVKAAFRVTDRALEQSAERLHGMPEFSDLFVRRLDKYEVLDFEQKLEDTYGEIMETLSELPREPLYKESEVGGAAEKVREGILGRVTITQALAATGVIAGLFCLTFIPAAIYLDIQPNGSAWTIAGAIAVGVGLLVLVVALLLQFKRWRLAKRIDDYTGMLRRILAGLTASAKDFSRYMSRIGSHVRGATYLKLFRLKNFNEEQLLQARKTHSRAIDTLMQKMRIWSVAFHIPVNFEEDAIEDHVSIDPLHPPGSNPLYTFEAGTRYEIPLNISGDSVSTPFAFVTQLKINREELYNDE